VNRKTGDTTYQVQGTTYTLKLDSDAMVAMEEAASTPDRRVFFHQIMSLAQAGSWTHQRILVWASLRLHHPEVTLKQAGDIMLESAADEMARSIKDLTIAATPDAADLDALGVTPPANPPEAQPKKRGRKPKQVGTGGHSTVSAGAAG
jgi:hypothetical protein